MIGPSCRTLEVPGSQGHNTAAHGTQQARHGKLVHMTTQILQHVVLPALKVATLRDSPQLILAYCQHQLPMFAL